MAIDIKLKHSSVQDKAPQPTDLTEGELALNINSNSPAAYIKDSAGAVVKLAGPGALGGVWDRTGTALSPHTAGDTVQISAGKAGQPGLTPVGDPDTGIYSPGADEVAISTNGTQRLLIDSSGNVNIDSNTLYVNATTNRVGLGTSVPSAPFDIMHNVDNSIYFRAGVTQTFRQLLFGTELNAGGQNNHRHTIDASSDIGELLFKTHSINALFISAKQQVGIRTTSPGSALEINAAAATSPFIAKINTAEAARIDSSSNLLVGRSSAVAGSSAKIQCTTTANLAGVGVYADNTAATAGGLVAGDIYRKADGTLMIAF